MKVIFSYRWQILIEIRDNAQKIYRFFPAVLANLYNMMCLFPQLHAWQGDCFQKIDKNRVIYRKMLS